MHVELTDVSYAQVKDVRQEPVKTDELPANSGSWIQALVPGSVSGQLPDHP